jgi:hypothetical protein
MIKGAVPSDVSISNSSIQQETMKARQEYPRPGNIQELESIIKTLS